MPKVDGDQCPYETLGVPPTATPDEIKAKYYDMCKQVHPDVDPHSRENGSDPSGVNFQRVHNAYTTLMRREYDRGRLRGHATAPTSQRVPYPGDHFRQNAGTVPTATRGRIFVAAVCVAMCIPVYFVGTSVQTRFDRQRSLFSKPRRPR
eukprot:m.212750 g.212750  ORF g.212750 m.212750 type:complete len:149 (-) comp25539_c1_seq2:2363-2809(-)